MDPPSGKASKLERSASMRTSIRLSIAADEDGHDLSALVLDGSRAGDSPSTIPSLTESSTSASTLQVPDSPAVQRTTASRPSSIAKPPRQTPESISVRHDAPPSAPTTGSPLSRVSSVSTESPIVQVESPYQGPSGPSHPYMMYPQRTLSIATSSTSPMSERSYQGPRGPAHPYGMYDQNIEPTDAAPAQSVSVVGFPGNQDAYQRRIGPDGEEAGDLIGPLGHTEELPPYTRYPEETYARKGADTVTQPAPAVIGATVAPSPAPVQAIPGAGGIGLATRNPEFSSTDDLDSPRSRLSTRSFTSDSNHEINQAALTVTEKPDQGKWQKRAKNKMLGVVPYWAICLLALGLALMGIILGAVIGTFLARHKRPTPHHNDSQPQTSPTATVDVQPLQTVPPDLPALNTGVFSLPPLIASQAPSTCFNISTQAQAWTCNMPFTVYFMEIDRLPDQPPTSQFALKLTSPYNNGSVITRYSWGMQPPLIQDPVKLILVNDTAEPYRGPAWWMQMSYNKTVVLAEGKFPSPTNAAAAPGAPSVAAATPTVGVLRRAAKRWGGGGPGGPGSGFKRKGLAGAQPGDKPWICTWPGTILEAFIYPSQNNSFKPFTALPPQASQTGAPPDSLQSTTTASSFSTPTPNLQNPGQVTTTNSGPAPSGSGFSGDWSPQPEPSPYPKVIKFEERRYPGSGPTTASCRQVEILDDGQNYRPVLDVNGKPIEVIIVENDEDAQQQTPYNNNNKRWLDSNELQYRDMQPADQLSDCGCIWWFT